MLGNTGVSPGPIQHFKGWLTYFDTLMMFQQGSLRQSYLIGTPLYKQAKSDSVILLGPIQNRVVVYSSIAG